MRAPEPGDVDVATRYMSGFRCLGPDCPDTCCGDWGIHVDAAHHEMLRARLPPDELARKLTPVAGTDPRRVALIVLAEGGRCSFLEPGRLCSIQSRYGEDHLPDECASYPRVVGRVGGRVEVAGALSCPEVARLALLEPGAHDLVGSTAAALGRGRVQHGLDDADADPYRRSFPAVRRLLLELAALEGYPIASRLFFIAFFADRTRASLRRGATPKNLLAMLEAARRPEVLEQLHADLAAVQVDRSFPLSVVRSILTLNHDARREPLRRLFADVLGRYAEAGAPLEGDVATLERVFVELASAWPRCDELVARYVQHYLFREWYIEWPSLIDYVFGLLERIALFRFLVVGHPATAPQDAIVTRVAVSLTRFLEHDGTLARQLVAALGANGMTELDHAVCLLKC